MSEAIPQYNRMEGAAGDGSGPRGGAVFREVLNIASDCAAELRVRPDRRDEVAHGAAIDFWRTFGQPDSPHQDGPIRPWLAACVRHRAAEERRVSARDARRLSSLDDEPLSEEFEVDRSFGSSAESRVMSLDVGHVYRKTLNALPPACREIWVRRREGASLEAIAAERGIAVNTVRAQAAKASHALAAAAVAYRMGEI